MSGLLIPQNALTTTYVEEFQAKTYVRKLHEFMFYEIAYCLLMAY